jgi:hypothetical protein
MSPDPAIPVASDTARPPAKTLFKMPPAMVELLCLVSLVGVLIPNILWIVRDHTPWPWDQAWYGEVSVNLWFNLTRSMSNWLHTMLAGIDMKPPGVVWLGQLFVPLGWMSGSIESALLFSVVLAQALTLYLVFRIGRALAPHSYAVPALGVVFASAGQLFVGLSHQFLVEPLQALAVAWTLLVVIRCKEWSAPRIVLHVAGSLIVGLLAKATTPLYCLLPFLYVGLVLLRKPLFLGWQSEWRSNSMRVLAFFVCVAGPLTAGWYAVNLKAVWRHIREASSGEIALQYGARASVPAKMAVWLKLLDQSFLSRYLGWTVVIVIVAGMAYRIGRGGTRAIPSGGVVVVILSALQCALLLLVFSMNDAVDSRYMYAMYVFLVTILMWACAPIASRAILAVAFAICAFQFLTVHRIALGAAGTAADQGEWLGTPHEDRTRYNQMERIVAMTSTKPGYNIVGVEEPWLNANTASFFAAKRSLDTGVRSYYTSLGYAEKDIATAVKRVEDFNIMFYITLDERFQTVPANFVNIVSLPMLKHISEDPKFQPVPFASADGVLIFQHK